MLLFLSSKQVVNRLAEQHLRRKKGENNFVVKGGKRLFRKPEWGWQGCRGLPQGCTNFSLLLSKTEQCWGQGESTALLLQY